METPAQQLVESERAATALTTTGSSGRSRLAARYAICAIRIGAAHPPLALSPIVYKMRYGKSYYYRTA